MRGRRRRAPFAAGDELVEEGGVGAKDHAAVGGVGAGGVELVHYDAGGVVEGAWMTFEGSPRDGETEDALAMVTAPLIC